MDSEAILQAIESNLMSWMQKISGENYSSWPWQKHPELQNCAACYQNIVKNSIYLTTTPSMSEPVSNSTKGVLHTQKIWSVASPSDAVNVISRTLEIRRRIKTIPTTELLKSIRILEIWRGFLPLRCQWEKKKEKNMRKRKKC